MLSATANAGLIETQAAAFDADCCLSTFFNTRIGDNQIGPDSDNAPGSDWEVRTEQGAADTYQQRTYTSGTSEAFTLTNNATLELITYTLGGNAYEMDFGGNIGWETNGLEIRIRDNISKGLRKVTLGNLSFQLSSVDIDVDTALTNNQLLVSKQGGPDPRTSALFIQDDLGRYLGDFTLSGTLTFEWEDSGDGAFEDPTAGDLVSGFLF